MHAEPTPGSAARFVALVAYDGSDFAGFQVQAAAPTIQGSLEQAVARFARLHGRMAGARRTDAGVHARGQVVNLALDWAHGAEALQRAWNAHLPPTIAVQQVRPEPVVAGERPFHPRFSARSRTYRYRVVEQGPGSAGRSPLEGRYAHIEAGRLDVSAMQQAAQHLVGRHDFAAFGRPPQGDNSVRNVAVATWQRVESSLPLLPAWSPAQESLLVFTITADAFLQHMVRRLVGTLLEVGRGRLLPDAFGHVLAAGEPARAAPPAFAGGLVLEHVEYDPVWGLQMAPRPLEPLFTD